MTLFSINQGMHACRMLPGCLNKLKTSFLSPVCYQISLKAERHTFWDSDRRSGYNTGGRKNTLKMIKKGRKMLKNEFKLFFKEKKNTMYNIYYKPLFDPVYLHGDFEPCWHFNGEDSLKNWQVTTDRSNLEGYSDAFFSVSKSNKGLFNGFLCTDVPKNGISKKAGYVNLRSPLSVKSFKRVDTYDWLGYTHLVLRIRGDGRAYMLNFKMRRTEADYDIFFNDMYSYPLYTRGGPYWQIAKIPFSKFFFNHKGRIQDKQRGRNKIPLGSVEHMSITLADKADGPFNLEIDSVVLLYDLSHSEECAYEEYDIMRGTAALD